MTATAEAQGRKRPDLATERAPDVQLSRDARRQAVQQLTLAHLTQRDIAERLGVAPSTVHKDQQVIRRWWRAKAVQHFDDMIAAELAKYDEWERQILLRPYVESNDGEAVIFDTDGPSTRPLSNDDVAMLMKISAERRRLVGLDMPVRTEVAVTATVDERLEHALELVATFGERRAIYGDDAIEARAIES